MIFYKKAYDDGYRHGWLLSIRSVCPYAEETDEYESWHLGFDCGNAKVYSSFLMNKFAIPDMDLDLYKEMMIFAEKGLNE